MLLISGHFDLTLRLDGWMAGAENRLLDYIQLAWENGEGLREMQHSNSQMFGADFY